MINLYELLEVSPRASVTVINAAWKALVRECHPDTGKPDDERTRNLNRAREILSDPEKRRQYDQLLASTSNAPGQPNGRNAYPKAYPDFDSAVRDAAMNVGQAAVREMMRNVPAEFQFLFARAR